jgi:hypothetical protein
VCLPLLVYEVVARARGIRLGDHIDWPIFFVFPLDFPSSLIANILAIFIEDWKPLGNSDVIFYSVASLLFLVFGVAQYYLVGKMLRAFIRHRRKRRAGRQA